MNRSPVGGRITRIDYRPGKFLPAYKEASNDNELNEIWIEQRRAHLRLPSGRRPAGAPHRLPGARGDEVERGERIGLMKFGSRMDVFLPPDPEILVSVGQQVVGGEIDPGARPFAGERDGGGER